MRAYACVLLRYLTYMLTRTTQQLLPVVSACLYVCLSVCLYVCMFVCPSTCLSILSGHSSIGAAVLESSDELKVGEETPV